MALFIEAVGASGVVQKAPINGRKLQLTARPGLSYRIVDENGAKPDLSLTIKRVDNDLLIEGLPSDSSVQVVRFFANCTPESSCVLVVDGIGGQAGAPITPATEPIAALADGSFVLQAPSSLAPVIPTAPESEFSFRPLLLGVGALALAGAGGGGGGGGGGSTPSAPQPPGAVQVTSPALTKDTTPVVSGTTDAGASVTVTFNLASPVSYQTTADANGNWSIDLGTATPRSGSLPTDGLPADTTITYLVAATNSAGAGPASSFSLTTDITAPTTLGTIAAASDDQAPITGAITSGGVTNDTTPTLSGTVTAPLATGSGAESLEVLRDGVVVGTIAAPLAGTNWSFTDTGAPDGVHQYTVRVVDAVGNAGAQSAPFALTIDTAGPAQSATIASITDDVTPVLGIVATGGTTNDTAPTLSGTISAVLGTGDEVRIFRDGVDVGAATVTGTNWTFSDVGLIDSTNYSYVAAVVDPAGNAGTASAPYAIRVETQNPTLQITDATADALTNAPVVFTFAFSRSVTGFDITDVAVTGGTAGALSGSGASYQLTVTPAAGSTTPITVTVGAGAAIDAAGNPNDAAAPATQGVDTQGPSVAISDGTGAAVTNAPVTFTFNFGEPVTGFTADDVTVSGGTKGAFSGSGALYQLVVTPTAGATGTISVGVNAGAATDALGNPNGAATPATQDFDTQAPTLAITDNVGGGTASGPVTFTFTFSEPVSGFTAGDVTVAGGTAGALSTVNASTYQMTVTPPADATGTISVSVGAGLASDAAGNGNAAAGPATQAFDTNVPPTVVITDNTPGATTNAPVTFNITFSEPVFGLSIGDVIVAGGTKGALIGADGSSSYQVVVTPTADSVSPITVDVPAGVANDAGGNANLAATQASQGVDTRAPRLTSITDDIGAATTSGPVTFIFQFDETVTGFEASDVTISAGSKGAFTGSGQLYQLVVNAPSNSTGTITASVADGAAVDAVGNSSLTTAAPGSQDFETVRPTLAISDNEPGTLAAGETVTFTFTFTEAVTGFDASDVAVTSGTKGTFTPVSALEYSLVVTPSANASGSIGVSVAAGAATDTAGNPNVGPVASSQAFDTRTVTVSQILDDAGLNVGALTTSPAVADDASPTIRASITGTLGGGETVHILSSVGGDLGAATLTGGFYEITDNLAAQANVPVTYSAQIVGAPVTIVGGSFLYTYDPGAL